MTVLLHFIAVMALLERYRTAITAIKRNRTVIKRSIMLKNGKKFKERLGTPGASERKKDGVRKNEDETVTGRSRSRNKNFIFTVTVDLARVELSSSFEELFILFTIYDGLIKKYAVTQCEEHQIIQEIL